MTYIIIGDCSDKLSQLEDKSCHCCVTSPPFYGLRDYQTGTWVGGDENCSHIRESKKGNVDATTGHKNFYEIGGICDAIYKTKCKRCGAIRQDKQVGLEETPDQYIEKMVEIFREVHRVLRDDGTLWLNLGDSYGDAKQLSGIPWRVAFALQADGWILRQDIIWHKPNPMPEPVKDRCTKSHEYIFLLSKTKNYFFDSVAIEEPAQNWGTRDRSKGKYTSGDVPILGGKHGGLKGKEDEENPQRNKRSVWSVCPKPFKQAHFAVFPDKLIEPCILAGTSEYGCCQKCGSPWTREVESERKATRPNLTSKVEGLPSEVVGNRDPKRHVTTTKTVGWNPSCSCGAEMIPCTVLDPFVGSGTTLAVASTLHREGIGIELNPDYAAIANRRIQKTITLFHNLDSTEVESQSHQGASQ